jgi:DNA replication and repair protein RecF
VLDQRNRLLRDAARAGGLGSAQRGALDALTDQLISHGGQILAHRAEFVAALAIHAGRFHQELTGGEAGIEVTYQPGWASTVLASGPPDADFRKALVAVQNEEMRRGTTLAGPHRDDLRFVLGGMDARIYASRGEQRTIALSLKLAELRQMEELAGEPPVLLLDDVMSELDDDRSRRVVSLAVRHYQVFVTGAAFRVFPPEVVEKASVFRVQSGAVELRQDGGSTQ